jgi:hypothetical protein
MKRFFTCVILYSALCWFGGPRLHREYVRWLGYVEKRVQVPGGPTVNNDKLRLLPLLFVALAGLSFLTGYFVPLEGLDDTSQRVAMMKWGARP